MTNRRILGSGFLIFCSFLILAMPVQGGEKNKEPRAEAAIREANKNIPFLYIKPFDPIPGLYEAGIPDGRGGKIIYYFDSSGKYIINGHIFDTTTRKDLTAARLEEINSIDWRKLPLDKAIVSGDPKGTPVAIFTDPDCPYCKQLERELRNVKGLKIYTFLFPIEKIHPEARAKAEAIWCSKDQVKALHDVLIDGKTLDVPACENPVGDIIALGKELGIHGTPTLIAADGRKRGGTMEASRLMAWATRNKNR